MIKREEIKDFEYNPETATRIKKIIQRIHDSKQLALLKNNPEIEIKTISKVIWQENKWNLIKVFFIKVSSITFATILSMLLGFYLEYLRRWNMDLKDFVKSDTAESSILEKIIPNTHRDLRVLIGIPLAACFITMINALKNEHSQMLLKKSTTITGKIIKKMIFQKVGNASRECL